MKRDQLLDKLHQIRPASLYKADCRMDRHQDLAHRLSVCQTASAAIAQGQEARHSLHYDGPGTSCRSPARSNRSLSLRQGTSSGPDQVLHTSFYVEFGVYSSYLTHLRGQHCHRDSCAGTARKPSGLTSDRCQGSKGKMYNSKTNVPSCSLPNRRGSCASGIHTRTFSGSVR